MGTIAEAFAAAWRDYQTAGVPASGEHEPVKSEIRAIGPAIETVISFISVSGLASVTFETRAGLEADLAHGEGTVALVYADPSTENNDLYVKSGVSGEGAWTKTDILYDAASALVQGFVDQASDEADRAEAAADSVSDVVTQVKGANLYDPATMRVEGSYVKTNGDISAAAGWAFVRIPVTPGETYAWASNTARRVGASFLSGPTTGVSGTYISEVPSGNEPIAATAPAGAAFLAINVKSPSDPEPSQIMVNEGVTALAYEPYSAPVPSISSGSVVYDAENEIVELVTGKNLYNPAAKQIDRLVANSGKIDAAVGWAATELIPVTPGQSITISASADKRVGTAFYDAAGAFVPGSYDATATYPQTLVVPAGAAYMATNLKSTSIAEPVQVQIEVGAEATTFEPFVREYRIRAEKVAGGAQGLSAQMRQAELSLLASDPVNASSFESRVAGDTFQHTFKPFLPASHRASRAFNFAGYSLNGSPQTTSANDDIAPYRMYGATIGANHGYFAGECIVVGHGKTLEDVGSVWTNGGKEWVIVDVPTADKIWVSARTDNAAFGGGALSHVSGATNTGSFTPSSVTTVQWYPVFRDHQIRPVVDKRVVEKSDASFYVQESVGFAESYKIMNKPSIMEWLITQAGTPTNIAEYDGTADVAISILYEFDLYGGVTIYSDFVALNDVAQFQDIMFAQAYRMAAKGGFVKYFVPDTVPFTFETVLYDFSKPVDMTVWEPSGRLDFTPDTWADPAHVPDRLVEINGEAGFAIGYLPVRDAEPSRRATLASRKAAQISEPAKIYMSAVDSAAITSLEAGDKYGVVAYRVLFALHPNRTASYVVRARDADWLFVDWHASVSDVVDLPPDLQGRRFEVDRKTDGVEVLSAYGAESIAFEVSTSGGAGQYARLKFPK